MAFAAFAAVASFSSSKSETLSLEFGSNGGFLPRLGSSSAAVSGSGRSGILRGVGSTRCSSSTSELRRSSSSFTAGFFTPYTRQHDYLKAGALSCAFDDGF
jgi:hypothetical protein